jgi:hypothetical protein
MAQSQQSGLKRTDLQQHDLGVPGRGRPGPRGAAGQAGRTDVDADRSGTLILRDLPDLDLFVKELARSTSSDDP